MSLFRKIDYNSPVVLSYFFLSAALLVLGYMTHGYSTGVFFSIYRTSFLDPLLYLRLFTHVLGHANFTHFINNFLLLLIVGPILEEKYGSKRLLTMMLFTAVITGLVNIFLFPQTALLGASGIVFMCILLASITNFKSNTLPLTFLLVLVIYLGQELYSALHAKDNISHLTHIIGGICGAAFGFRGNNRN